jgi:hypothetical protein
MVALLSGLATIFALFGGQQWLEQKGWTLDTNATAEATTETSTDTATPEPDPTETPGPAGEPSETDWDGVWAGMTTWSAETFDNPLWGITAIGVSMLLAVAMGALIVHALIPMSAVSGFFQWLLALVCAAAVVLMGVLLHSADPGYLIWFIILTVVSVLIGIIAPALVSG